MILFSLLWLNMDFINQISSKVGLDLVVEVPGQAKRFGSDRNPKLAWGWWWGRDTSLHA
jgi:hypothetical protein